MSARGANVEKTPKKDTEDTALDSVRRLEERLADKRGAQEAAESSVAAARGEAERLVREARGAAEVEATGRHREALDRADEEAGRIVAEAESRAGRLRALAEEDRPAAVRKALALILPGLGS